MKRLNAVAVFRISLKSGAVRLHIATFNLWPSSIDIFNPTTRVDKVFPDKLANLHGFTYKAVAGERVPRIFRTPSGEVVGLDAMFIETVAQKQNATFSITLMDFSILEDTKKIRDELVKGKLDLFLNSMELQIAGNKTNTFNTFEVNGYCAMVPLPPQHSFLLHIFDPYDWMSWLFMVLSLVGLAMVWRIFKAHKDSQDLNSAGHMVFLILAGFLGQSFSFRHFRWFQIFMFAVVILGNAYQSLLISLLISARDDPKLSTIDEMLATDFNYMSDITFYGAMLNFHSKNSMNRKLSISMNALNPNFDFKVSAANKSVFVFPCDLVEEMFTSKSPNASIAHVSNSYYILPEKFFSFFISLLTTRFSPFNEKLEEFSLRIFESGVKSYWKVLLELTEEKINLEQLAIDNEEDIIKIGDLISVFHLWGIGITAALIAFTLEVHWEDFRAKMRQFWVERTWKKAEKKQMEARRKRYNRPTIQQETFEMINCDLV
jgi:hypothetical protein